MRILVDMDGVMADFNTLLIERFEAVGFAVNEETVLKDWDASSWFHGDRQDLRKLFTVTMDDPEFWLEMEPMPGLQEGFRLLLEDNHEIVVVSTPWWSNPLSAGNKWEWLRKNLKKVKGFDLFHDVVFTTRKYLVHGDVLIDDKPKHLDQWLEYNMFGIVFDWPYNSDMHSDGVWRVTDWPEAVYAVGQVENARRTFGGG